MLAAPATTGANVRKPVKKRAMKIVLPPCRS